MPQAWGFKDQQTALDLAALVRQPRDIGPANTTPRKVPRRIGGGMILAKTPVGGIPAATGSGPYTFGSAVCMLVGDDGTVGSETVTVKNIVNQAIAANVVIKAARVGASYVVDVASCGV